MIPKFLFAMAIPVALVVGNVHAAHHEDASPVVETFADCPGPVSVWRDNELTETGSMAGFHEAARGHQAWLDSKGYKVRIRTWIAFGRREQERPGAQIAFGSETLYPSYEEFDTVMSTRDQVREESAYAAFLQKYRDNTRIKTERLVCSSE